MPFVSSFLEFLLIVVCFENYRIDISGERTLRNMYNGVVGMQGAQKNLPRICTNHLDPTSVIVIMVFDLSKKFSLL